MDKSTHDMGELFEQLGLQSNPAEIEAFIATHSVPEGITLDRAEFWSDAQARFLREAWVEDADWVELVDQLDARLRH